jgi:hypothetical protein
MVPKIKKPVPEADHLPVACVEAKNEWFYTAATLYLGHALAQWLRHCATNRKVAGSNPDGVIGIFHLPNPGRTMVLGSTQPPTEMSTRSISCG